PGHAERAASAAVGEDRGGHRFEKAHPSHATVAAAPAAVAARADADRVAVEPYREAQLEHLRVGEPGVRHVRLHDAGPVESGARARAAGDRLVVLIALV